MTVYKISKNKIKITLSDSEVIAYFGNYDKINLKYKDTKFTVNMLLRNSLKRNYFNSKGRLIIYIKAIANMGCTITVLSTENMPMRKTKPEDHVFEFVSFNNMLRGVSALYKVFPNIQASLYKTENAYRLVASVRKDTDLCFLKEFSNSIDGDYALSNTEEYGKLLIKDNAVRKIGSIFKVI